MCGVETLHLQKIVVSLDGSLALVDHGKLKLGQTMDHRHYKPGKS